MADQHESILSRLGHALQAMWGNETRPAPSVQTFAPAVQTAQPAAPPAAEPVTIDLDQPAAGSDKSTMRDGPADMRAYSFDKSFRRDTKADQSAVKRAYENRAARQADELLASYRTQLAAPSAVAGRLQQPEEPPSDTQRALALAYLRGGR